VINVSMIRRNSYLEDKGIKGEKVMKKFWIIGLAMPMLKAVAAGTLGTVELKAVAAGIPAAVEQKTKEKKTIVATETITEVLKAEPPKTYGQMVSKGMAEVHASGPWFF
jgi:hypothetical protein